MILPEGGNYKILYHRLVETIDQKRILHDNLHSGVSYKFIVSLADKVSSPKEV